MACAAFGIPGLAGRALSYEIGVKLRSTGPISRTRIRIVRRHTASGPGFSVRASSEAPSSGPLASEDVRYLIKFGIWSVVGAAAIKYGSLLFPDVTVPDISLALILVASPVLTSVFVLLVAGANQHHAPD